MKNKAKKMLTLALAATVALGSLSAAACKPSGNEDENSTQSILYVSNYAGGFGSKWMDEIEKRFEAKYANESFEEGKVGVDIKVSHNKTLGSQYYDRGVTGSKQEVFFVEDVDYYKWVNDGKMLDISSVVTETNPEDGKTVLSKLTKDEQDFYNAGGKYYAIPHHDHQAGIIYDIDLFEQEGFYFAKNGAPSEKNYTGTVKFTSDGAKSAGPDGEYDSPDDGLPATYDEFYTLCDYIAKKKSDVTLVPFIWSGQNRRDYVDWLLSELTADFEGAEQLRLNYTFDGTAENLVSVDDAGNVTRLGDTKITTDNGYMMYQTEGRLKALEFVDRIVDSMNTDVKWGDSSLFGPDSQLQAQDKYVYGATGINSTRYAFLVDGTWWESEASDTFDRVEDRTAGKYTKNSMRFGLLPLPKASADKTGEPFTIATTEVTVGFVKSNIKESKINLAKTFMQFVYAEDQLRAFNTISGMPAAPDYKLTDAEYEALSVYEKSIYDVKDNSVSPYSTTPVYINNYKSLMLKSTFTAKGSQAVESLRTRSAIDHFRDLYSKSGRDEGSWNLLIKNLK